MRGKKEKRKKKKERKKEKRKKERKKKEKERNEKEEEEINYFCNKSEDVQPKNWKYYKKCKNFKIIIVW